MHTISITSASKRFDAAAETWSLHTLLGKGADGGAPAQRRDRSPAAPVANGAAQGVNIVQRAQPLPPLDAHLFATLQMLLAALEDAKDPKGRLFVGDLRALFQQQMGGACDGAVLHAFNECIEAAVAHGRLGMTGDKSAVWVVTSGDNSTSGAATLAHRSVDVGPTAASASAATVIPDRRQPPNVQNTAAPPF